jgi:Xaa-Pro aminopeptidase
MRSEQVDTLFLGLSADLEYLTGIERGIPFFGQSSYAHGWVTGAFFRPDMDPVFVLPRMVAAFELTDEPRGEVVVVNETDDGLAVFERVARGLGLTGSVAVGDRVWAETTINLGRIVGFDVLRTGSSLVNELRRVKTAQELEAMGRACRAVERTMDAVAPQVVPGVTMADLVEEVEYQLRRHGSRTPSFATHIFTGLEPDDLDSSTSTARVEPRHVRAPARAM